MDAERVLDVLDVLSGSGIPAWLDGGWGIDALLETQTRPHDDLDLLVRLDDIPQFEEVLGHLGYARAHGGLPLSFEMTDAEGHQVDVHPVSFSRSGAAIYKMANGEEWVYPPGSLAATGAILGRKVRCQTPEMQLLAHMTGYALDAVHHSDVLALSKRFGLTLPPFRSA